MRRVRVGGVWFFTVRVQVLLQPGLCSVQTEGFYRIMALHSILRVYLYSKSIDCKYCFL